MKRRFFRLGLLLLLLIPLLTLSVAAADQNAMYGEQLRKSGAADLSSAAPQTARKSLNELDIDRPDSGSMSNFTPAGMLRIFTERLKESAQAPLKAVAAVIGILLVLALLGTLKNSFGDKPLKNVFDTVGVLCAAAVMLTPVLGCISSAAQTIRQSSSFMNTFLPVFAGLSVASGHPASATVFQGLLLMASQIISELASTTFVPMVDIFLAFCVIGSVAPGINIEGIAGFARKLLEWALGFCLTIFTGLLTIQGLISQAADTVSMKAAKFVVGSVVPVIGGSISDAMNTVVSCANLLKTFSGAYAIVVFLLAFLPPLLDCILWMLASDLSLAAAQMLGVEGVSSMLKAVTQALKLLVALVLACGLTMIISISVMLLLGIGG